LSPYGAIDGFHISRIAADDMEAVACLGDRCRIAGERRNLIASVKKLPDGMAAGLSGRNSGLTLGPRAERSPDLASIILLWPAFL
jgi:hypothetical protein